MSAFFEPALGARALIVAALFGIASCKSETTAQTAEAPRATASPTKTQARIKAELGATADVVAIGREDRRVTLRGEDGRLLEVWAGKDVRNFDQISVGDKLRVRYEVSLTASLRPAGEKLGPVGAAVTAARAKKGEKPAGEAGVAISLRVKIESIDVPHDIVVFSAGTDDLIAHRIATSEGREFVKGLKIGDVVRLDYAEALALAIETIR